MQGFQRSTLDVIPQRMVASSAWHRTLGISVAIILLLGLSAIPTFSSLTGLFFLRQDLAIGFVLIAVFVFVRLNDRAHAATRLALPGPRTILASGAAALIIGGWIGHYTIMHGYGLSRDEQMALQDAAIFANGQFAAPVPSAWQEMVAILNREFNSGIYGSAFTGSGYRPINALAHMLMMKIGMLHFTAPVMSAIGLAATCCVAKRIWPADRQIQSMSAVFYLCSTQIWAASMTTYAMSTLLALDMVWLALFLRRDMTGYGLALIVGFLAVGVHQVPYHPMFAAPFIVLLLIERRWLVSAIYIASYAAFILFWLRYEHFVLFMIGASVATPDPVNILNRFSHIISVEGIIAAVSFTAANLFRYFSWQHLLVLPLLIVGGKVAVRDRNWLLIAMVAACLFPPILKAVLVPYQGHGWGYRYCHGIIGLTCILAAVGWRELSDRSIVSVRTFVIASLVSVGIALPWQLWNASRFSAGYAAVDQQLGQLKTDFVVVDSAAAPFANDLVNNRADLSNRPLRLLARHISPQFIPELCKRGTVTLYPTEQLDPINRFWGITTQATPEYRSVVAGFHKQCPRQIK